MGDLGHFSVDVPTGVDGGEGVHEVANDIGIRLADFFLDSYVLEELLVGEVLNSSLKLENGGGMGVDFVGFGEEVVGF